MKTNLPFPNRLSNIAALISKLSLLIFAGIFCFGDSVFAGIKPVYNVKATHINNTAAIRVKQSGLLGGSDQAGYKNNYYNYLFISGASVDKGFRHIMQNWEILAGWGDNYVLKGNNLGSDKPATGFSKSIFTNPVISTTGTLSALTTTYGTASASSSFNVSGTSMTAGILVTPPSRFEVSKDNATFSSTVTIGAAGIIASTPVYIRLIGSVNAGSYSGNVVLSSTGASSINEPTAPSTVNKAPLTITANNEVDTYGQAIPALTITSSGFVNGDNTASLTTLPTASVMATAASPAGSYAITASGAVDPNYTITYAAGTLTISKAPLTVTADNQTINLGQPIPTLTATYNGFVNGDNSASLTSLATVNTTANSSSPVGSYPIMASGAVDPNYTISYVAGTLKINPALPVLTITANNQSSVYAQAIPALTITYSGFVNGDNTTSLTTLATASTMATAASPAGSYAITASGAVDPNYNIKYVQGSLTINKAPLTVTADNQTMNLGQAIPALTVSYNGFVNGDNSVSLTTAATAATTATPSSPIGNYPITVSGAVDPNYTISYVAGTLKINPALPVLTITANNQSSVYAQAIPALTITYSGFVNGDNTASLTTLATASTMATAASPAGSYAITASGAVDPNYNIKYVQGSLTISKAPLTVTADNQTMNPGQAIPALTVSYNGFVNGDNSASLTTAATAATTATSSSPIGNYPITASGAVDPNYTISYVAGTLNIAGVPALSYSSPQTYTAGTAIASLAPTSNSVAAPGYNNSPVTLGFGLNNPTAVAVDAAGNVYIADANNNAVKKIAVGGFPVTIATISDPHGIAVDAAGNVYVDSYATNGVVYKIPVGGGSPITWATGFADAGGIAVDGAGKVYVAATGNGGLKVIPAGGGSWAFLSYSFNAPTSVAVDAPGNVYLAVSGQNVIDEIPVNGGQPIQLATLANPTGVAVDAAGNVYATSHGTNALYQIPAGGGTPVLVSDAFNNPMGIAVDGAGNVYVVDAGIASIDKIVPVGGYFITPALPAGLSFNETTGAISGTPLVGSPAKTYTVTAYNSSGGGSTTLSIQVNLPLLPTVAYSNPHAYLVQAAITPLAPVSGGVAAPLYSRSTVTLGSGFVNPYDVALDAAGDLFIVQQSSGTVTEIPAGNGTPVQLGSGLGPSNGVAVDAAGNVYVASFSSNAVYKIPAGNGTPVAIGSGFSGPTGVAVDVLGNVYVADFNNNAVKEIPVGGGAPFAIGSGFSIPNGVAVDVSGNVYVADSGNGSVKKIPVGGGSPIVLGTGIIDPYSVAVDAVGNVYVADRNADAIEEIMAGGNTTVTLGSGFNQPYGVAVDGIGNVYVADYYNNAVKKIKPVGGYYLSSVLPAGLSFSNSTGIISGTPTKSSPATNYIVTAYNSGGSSTTAVNIKINALTISYASPQTYLVGTAIPALTPTTIGGVTAPAYSGSVITLGSGFSTPTGVAVDVSGNVYIADAGNNLIKKIPVGGGAPVAIGSGFSHPEGVAVDASGNVYVADYNNNAVKEIPVAGGSPVTLGSGFVTPTGVAVDAAGNVYVADYGNNAVKEIPQGIGAPVTLGSGFSSPTGVAVDGAGNIYVADYGNRLVKEIPAGSTTPVTLGSGFSTPFGLTVDAAGNVFVADFGGGAVKEIAAGSTTPVSIGPAFGGPTGVATDEAGNVYVADFSASLIKEIKPIGGYYIGPLLPAGVAFSNATGAISGTPTVGSPATNYTVTAYNGSGNNSTTVSIKVNALTISYPTPKNYLADITISAFPPTSSGVAAAAYSNSTVFFGSGFSGPTGVAVDKSGNIFVADPIKKWLLSFRWAEVLRLISVQVLTARLV
jgi:streptogramin lyase